MEDGPLFRLSMPEGMEAMHLASPHDNPSQYLGAIFDEDNHLRGQARWEPVSDDTGNNDDDKSSPATAIAAAAIAVALVAGTAVYLANNEKFKGWWDKTIVHWWRDSVIHTADKVWSKITHQEENNSENSQPIALITANSEETEAFSKEVDGAIEECQSNMDSEEAQNRLLIIMYKAMDLARDIRELSAANIQDSPFDEKRKMELRQTMKKLTTQNVTNLINTTLERNITLLEKQEGFDAWAATLGNVSKDGDFVPLSSDALRMTLSLEPFKAELESSSHKDKDEE